MARAEALTADNSGITILVAVGYSGQWDLAQAAERCRQAGGAITEDRLAAELATAGLPDVDLMIRSGGESRISNFLLWQAAYAEMLFVDTLWPDFTPDHLARALEDFASRERRFGGR